VNSAAKEKFLRAIAEKGDRGGEERIRRKKLYNRKRLLDLGIPKHREISNRRSIIVT